jgi:O-antigen/teichoic acid export membrane protein
MSDERRADVRARAIRGAVSVGIRNLVVRGLGLVGVVALSRLLDPHEFGLLAFGLTLKILSDLIATGGLAAGLIRREEPPTEEELGAMVFFQLAISMLLVVVFALSGLLWGEGAFVAAIMALVLPISAFRVPSVIVLERKLDWNLVAKAEVTETLVYNVVAVLAVVAGAGIWGVAGASVLQGLVGTAILLRVGPVGFVRPRRQLRIITSLLRFGAKFQSVAVVAVARDQGLNLTVAAVGGVAMLGVWSIAYRLLQAILLLLQSLWRVSYSAMARAMEAGDDASRLVSRVLQISTTLVTLPAVCLAGSASAIVDVVFGDVWSAAASILPWGAGALVLWGAVSTACAGYLQARGDVTRFLVVVIAQSVVWCAVTVALVPSADAEGIGIGMLAGAAVYVLGIMYVMRRHARIRFVHVMWAPVAAGVAASVLGRVVANMVGTDVVGLVASVATAAASYLVLLAILRRSDLVALTALARRGGRAPAGATL